MQKIISAVLRNKVEDEKGIPTIFKRWEREPTVEEVMKAIQSERGTLYVLSKYGISCCSVKFYGSLEGAARAVKEEAMTAVSEKHPKWWLLVL